MLGKGRDTILTPYKEITRDNIFKILPEAYKLFLDNANDCDFLLNYDAGDQPLKRSSEKKVMEWIDVQTVDNVAHEVSDFWIGFGWGNPISLTLRGDADKEKSEGVKQLNYAYSAAGGAINLQKIANYVTKCGHCYTLIDINQDYEEGEAQFTRDVLDPRNAFLVRSSSWADRRVLMGVTFATDNDGNLLMTCYTKDERFFVFAENLNKKGATKTEDVAKKFNFYLDPHYAIETNFLGRVPIVEWYQTVDRKGMFETQIPALDNINLLVSDIGNGVEQNIQAIWWANNVEFPTKVVKDAEGNEVEVPDKPKSGDWVSTQSNKDGGNPTIQPLVIDYHLEDMQKSYTEQRSLVLQKCHVPQRNDNSGGSTGVAMDSAAGWADAESIASSHEEIIKSCQLDELKVVLRAIKESPDTAPDNPMLKLYANDIIPAIRRPKNSDIASKCNGITTLLSHGFSIEDVLSAIAFFPDATQTINRSKNGVDEYQKSKVFGDGESEGRTMADLSDQVQNSPILK